jgi:sugar fermentation stimulation protein A
VCADARLPARLLAEAVERGVVAPFSGMRAARYEVTYGDSRLDLRLDGPPSQCLVETKCVTLVRDGVALFPDAPTERGRRHVETLAQAVQGGLRAAVVFVIQRADAEAFAPNDATDPAFGDALRHAAERGVEVYAYCCRVTADEVRLDAGVSVRL